jgi:hypothetical protein
MHTYVDGKDKYFDVEFALSDSELTGIQTCAKCGGTGIDTYDFTIKEFILSGMTSLRQ